MTASFIITASAQDYQPEVGDNYVSFDFNQITGGIDNNVPNATFTKNTTIDGVSAVEFVPTPNAEAAWAAFPNLASAEAFDIKAAAKAE